MKNWYLKLLFGLVWIGAGIFALFNPFSAAVTAMTLAGWALLVVGMLQAYSARKSQGFSIRLGAGITAAAALFMGLLLLLGPFGDGTFLRLSLVVLLLVSGAAKLWSTYRMRVNKRRLRCSRPARHLLC
ncbi:DUF308 domain-containing protein [Roseovarius sp. S4756]|uniref:DUF308 domain-containing protein n=1 Tax=Roseovarius maritimus TaxID=3342637 RepID=UPI00372A7169